MEKALVSRCLVGELCRWDGKRLNAERPAVIKGFELIAVCPEMDGGLPCPRQRAEITSGQGSDVLDGKSRIRDKDNRDLTEIFLKGAQNALDVAKHHKIRKAFLKDKSPSCGVKRIYIDGRPTYGMGVTATLLHRHGIEVIAIE